MNCVSENCKHVRWKVVKDDRLKYFSHMLVPYCELGKTVSYPFGDNGGRNICECYEPVESEYKQVGCIYDEPLKPYFCEADWNCKDCPNWRSENEKAITEADKEN